MQRTRFYRSKLPCTTHPCNKQRRRHPGAPTRQLFSLADHARLKAVRRWSIELRRPHQIKAELHIATSRAHISSQSPSLHRLHAHALARPSSGRSADTHGLVLPGAARAERARRAHGGWPHPWPRCAKPDSSLRVLELSETGAWAWRAGCSRARARPRAPRAARVCARAAATARVVPARWTPSAC